MSATTSQALQKFRIELSTLLDKSAIIETTKGEKFTGKILGYDPENLNISLADVKTPNGEAYSRVFLHGQIIAAIYRKQEPFDLRGLSERIEKVFPGMVHIYDEAGVITVMEKIRVSESGIIEGTGPAADRVKRVYDQFINDRKTEPPKEPVTAA